MLGSEGTWRWYVSNLGLSSSRTGLNERVSAVGRNWADIPLGVRGVDQESSGEAGLGADEEGRRRGESRGGLGYVFLLRSHARILRRRPSREEDNEERENAPMLEAKSELERRTTQSRLAALSALHPENDPHKSTFLALCRLDLASQPSRLPIKHAQQRKRRKEEADRVGDE